MFEMHCMYYLNKQQVDILSSCILAGSQDGAELTKHKGFVFSGIKIVDRVMVDKIQRFRGKVPSDYDSSVCHEAWVDPEKGIF